MLRELENIIDHERRVLDEIEEARRQSLLEQEKLRETLETKIREEEEGIEEEVKGHLREEMVRLQSEKNDAIKIIQKSAEELLSDKTLQGKMVKRMTELLLNSS